MKPEAKKTSIFAGTALVLVILAFATRPSPRADAVFDPQGKEFYPDFKDPLKAASLEVIDFDGLTGTYKPFKVQVVNGVWSIPSHHNYPADGKERLKNTATAVMDLRKERIASIDPKMHEEFGVVDPLDPSAKGTQGRGKRVRLFDASGTALADFIFGKETQDGSGKRYVRIPDQKQTFVIKAQPDISVKFEDWVETDLLQMGSSSVRKVVIDKYTFDESAGAIKNRSTHFVSRDDSSAPWKLNEIKDTEEVNSDTVTTITSTLSGLKLAGVRAKPPVVARAKNMDDLGKIPQQQLMAIAQSMAQHGFFIFREGNNRYSIVSNEGEMQVSCDDGVVYTLRFGEILVGTGDEISAGAAEEPKKDKKDEKKDDKKVGSENRYLFVAARFEDSALPPAPAEPKPYVADPAKKPEEQKADEDKAKKEKDEYETKKKDWEKKKEDGKKRAEKLAARFADWYYVISADAFKKLRVDRPQLVKPKEAPKDEKKPEDKKPEAPKKPDEKKPDEKKPEDKKPDEKKTEDKKPEEKPKVPEEKKP
jgi:hypothetical protein